MICRCGTEVSNREKLCSGCKKCPIKRGEVFWTDLKSINGLQIGMVPSVIIQNDIGNSHSTTTMVIYSAELITILKSQGIIIKFEAPKYEGLHMTTIDKSRLRSAIGMLSLANMNIINDLIVKEIYGLSPIK